MNFHLSRLKKYFVDKNISPYLPGVILLCLALLVGLATYKDYGISWDEADQQYGGILSYNYIVFGSQDLYSLDINILNHGMGFDIVIVFFEKLLHLTDSRDIYLFRHLFTHICFLFSAFAGYILAIKLFGSRGIACLGFIMLAFAPRIYAHSFFNPKDLPFLTMTLFTLLICQIAFEKKRALFFLLLGIIAGFATSIRILGIMLGIFIFIFMFLDIVLNCFNKREFRSQVINIVLYVSGFCLFLYLGWPYLWRDPINNFIYCFNTFSHVHWGGVVLTNGKYESGLANLSWSYLPIWFFVTNPEIWLIAGFAGIIWIIKDFFIKPSLFIRNTSYRNFILYLMCFSVPILHVIFFHSVIYNDWRHLYFVYPSFVMMGLYAINKLNKTKFKSIVFALCIIQMTLIGGFMVKSHPFHEIYFNNLISHSNQYLFKNYDLEYWGCSYKQGLDYVLANDHSDSIKINCPDKILLDNNIMLLPLDQRKRIQYTKRQNADYFFPLLRNDVQFDDNISKIVDSINILNSTIFCIFIEEKQPDIQKQMIVNSIHNLRQSISADPNNKFAQLRIGLAYLYQMEYDSAIEHLESFHRLDPNNLYPLINLAAAYVQREKYPRAIKILEAMAETEPNNEDVCQMLGKIFISTLQYDSAKEYYEKLLSINPKSEDALFTLSYIYLHSMRYARALELLKRDVELNPKDAIRFANMGSCFLLLNIPDSAIYYTNKAISIDPTLMISYQYMAAIYKTMRLPDSVKKYETIIYSKRF